MKQLKHTLFALGLAAATSLFLTGCKEGGQASHDHDHDGHDHAGHDHGSEVAKTADGATAATTAGLIEKPTAEQIAAAKAYPLDTCIASGEKLGEMGEPVVMVYANQQIKFCCDSCVDDFKAEPAKFVAKLTAAK